MLYCSQEKGKSALLFSSRRKLVFYCSQEKGKGALLFSGEGNWCSTVFMRRELVLYCFQEKETGSLLFSNKRKLVFYFSQEKETDTLSTTVHRIGKGNRCATVLRRREKVLYCFQV